MSEAIVIIGCFDTKAAAFSFLRNCLLARGEFVLTINTGVMETTVDFPIDYPAEEVAQRAGFSLAEIRRSRDRGRAIDSMGAGAAAIMAELVDSGRVKGAIGMGGGGGTFIALAAMQPIPFGVPKLCLSTMAANDLSRQVGTKDIVLMPSVVDVAGFNGMLAQLVEQAAVAVCAMTAIGQPARANQMGRIAVSMFGNTTPCVEQCIALLEGHGYEVIAFHANGVGGRTMESLIADGQFMAVLDITTTELADHLCGGICSAGPDRLLAAGRAGIPQVVVPGCLDMVNFGHPDSVPAPYRHRHLYSWAPNVTLMRTDAAENVVLGQQLAQKVNQASAAVTVVLPLRGVSQLDDEGHDFYRPDLDTSLFDAIRANLSDTVQLLELPAHINEKPFSAFLVNSLLALLKTH
ncbi:Tm-1-like ATP-binding domain-containing protein [Fibrella forsythiae]|uniref:Tm-1-like ATP-binding domain-containing protein n=1 Tax=Fibrella forsythiae TaxID=2817061 RepID=A0ABS3JDF8_9BACT|nr:Tm-1-like ATP-binding domain-containing protein [Fibrella forsythiae]MBO0948026.1 Tm-1-like ATP-binding domain-containing protein [Fibrella forsythiae]